MRALVAGQYTNPVVAASAEGEAAFTGFSKRKRLAVVIVNVSVAPKKQVLKAPKP